MKIKIGKGEGVEVRLQFKGESCDCKTLSTAIEKELFNYENGEIYTAIEKERVYLGLGDKNKIDPESIRNAFFKLGEELTRIKAKTAYVTLDKIDGLCFGQMTKAAAEGLLQSEYRFNKFKSEKKDLPTLDTFYFNVPKDREENVEKNLKEIKSIIDGVFLARDLVNEPAMYMTPTKLAQSAKEMLEPLGVEVEILDKKQITELNMTAFLSVAKGSAQEPKFIIMKWNGDKSTDDLLAFVGKGLTYDSGGYSLKPTDSMVNMHNDMGGAGAVIGAMMAIAKNKLEKNVVAVVAACENMISGDAYKTGDIIGSMKGLTIEVLNTDAEGRLTLADALYYTATKLKPKKIVDVATLTGAAVMAFANITTAAVTNNDKMMKDMSIASERSGDLVWELPAHDLYREKLKGTFGDLKNSVVGGAGTITAGLFLEKFVEDIPWLHLDIAGTGFLKTKYGYLPKGATGAPVRMLYSFAKYEGKEEE